MFFLLPGLFAVRSIFSSLSTCTCLFVLYKVISRKCRNLSFTKICNFRSIGLIRRLLLTWGFDKYPSFSVLFTVHEARDLPSSSLAKRNKFYVVVRAGSINFKTTTEKIAFWNKTFRLKVLQGCRCIKIEIWNKRLIRKDTSIGSRKIKIGGDIMKPLKRLGTRKLLESQEIPFGLREKLASDIEPVNPDIESASSPDRNFRLEFPERMIQNRRWFRLDGESRSSICVSISHCSIGDSDEDSIDQNVAESNKSVYLGLNTGDPDNNFLDIDPQDHPDLFIEAIDSPVFYRGGQSMDVIASVLNGKADITSKRLAGAKVSYERVHMRVCKIFPREDSEDSEVDKNYLTEEAEKGGYARNYVKRLWCMCLAEDVSSLSSYDKKKNADGSNGLLEDGVTPDRTVPLYKIKNIERQPKGFLVKYLGTGDKKRSISVSPIDQDREVWIDGLNLMIEDCRKTAKMDQISDSAWDSLAAKDQLEVWKSCMMRKGLPENAIKEYYNDYQYKHNMTEQQRESFAARKKVGIPRDTQRGEYNSVLNRSIVRKAQNKEKSYLHP